MNTFISDARESRPPTLRDVARAAGVSLASASYALRGHPTVSASTQANVAAIAARLGYRANPQLSAFMQARRTGRAMRTDAAVALIYGGPSLPAEGASYFGLCLRGIHTVATEHGYTVDPIRWDAARDPGAARLQRILDQRGLRGLLLMPADKTSRWTLPLDWSRFFGVALDHSIGGVPVHRVTDHHSADMMTALTHIKAAGWRRPGLVLDPLNNERTCEMRLGAYLARTHHDFSKAPPPLLLAPGNKRIATLHAWLRRHRPDVVLSPHPGIADEITSLPPPPRPGSGPA
ncbi:LacI family DNA-binding transcriptional regulator, partial [Geminisphaera colitermitum]|uniref:LacI family DNA-binding transcriptional regulator n=1 Tax=Geminisphaera colitermitum TaxID=1148786 RepID=UPI0005BBF105